MLTSAISAASPAGQHERESQMAVQTMLHDQTYAATYQSDVTPELSVWRAVRRSPAYAGIPTPDRATK